MNDAATIIDASELSIDLEMRNLAIYAVTMNTPLTVFPLGREACDIAEAYSLLINCTTLVKPRWLDVTLLDSNVQIFTEPSHSLALL